MAAVNQFVPVSISVGRDLAEVAERLRRCTVELRGADYGRGSGVIWRPEGVIVTNAHVAASSEHLVHFEDGRTLKAQLVRRDPRRDLAVLRVSARGLPAARSRDATSLRAGELVLAVGNPMEVTGAFIVGLLSATPLKGDVLLRADIRLAPGNSGGPLADAQGRVIGINSMIVGGFGIAVATEAVERLLASGSQRSIGVTVRPVRLRVEGVPVLGLTIVELEPGGPAHLSGVLVGDVVVRVNGAWLQSPERLSDAIHSAEHFLPLEVWRAGRLQRCELMLNGENAMGVA